MTCEISKTRISCYLIIKTINHSDLEPYIPTGLECLYPKMTFRPYIETDQVIPNMPNPITETEVNNFLESKLNMQIASIDEAGYPMIQPSGLSMTRNLARYIQPLKKRQKRFTIF